jgi:hypothetical protein
LLEEVGRQVDAEHRDRPHVRVSGTSSTRSCGRSDTRRLMRQSNAAADHDDVVEGAAQAGVIDPNRG